MCMLRANQYPKVDQDQVTRMYTNATNLTFLLIFEETCHAFLFLFLFMKLFLKTVLIFY